jgi:Ser/Thr protein kinase RdoA (MazF antagonist)
MTSDRETRPTSGTLDFRPLYSTPQPKAIERFIDSHYTLAGPVSCRMLTRGMNDTFLVVTRSEERYVFRLSHHRARGAPDVGMETAFISHLSRSRVPVAEPIATREGSLFVSGNAPEGKREGVLFRFIDGRQSNMTNAADARANGRTLALLHDACRGLFRRWRNVSSRPRSPLA